MDYYSLIFLRVIHVACGVFWAGAAVYLALFILPAVQALGPEGGKFMQQVARTNKLPQVMAVVPILAILSGSFLIWRVSGGFNKDWVMSLHGMVLMTGSLCGIIAFATGLIINRPAVDRIRQVGLDIAGQGGVPVPHQMEELKHLQTNLLFGTRLIAWLLPVAVIAMSLAHYI